MSKIYAVLILGALALCIAVSCAQAAPAAAFTYQGKLTDAAGQPLSGAYDMSFKLFDAATNGSQIGSTVSLAGVNVSDGLFTVILDFGLPVFDGRRLWLETSIGTQVLSPRTELTAVPVAAHALTVADSSVGSSSLANSAVTNAKLASGSVTADKIAAGQVVKSINGLKDNVMLSAGEGVSITPSGNTLTLSTTAAGWSLTGNSGITSGTHFLGTTDNTPLEIRVNNMRALRLEPTPLPNVILGSPTNAVATGASGATISGGGTLGFGNRVTDSWGTIGGGSHNQVGDDNGNTDDSSYATVGGGYFNAAEGMYATVSGGIDNRAFQHRSTVGGGDSNLAGGRWSTVPGGRSNTASGDYSLAAGRRANARHLGSFVWADSEDADFSSSSSDQFLIRARGNVGINNNYPGGTLSIGPNMGMFTMVPAIHLGSPESAVMLMGQDSGRGLGIMWRHDGYYSSISSFGTHPLALQMKGGDVGIGTTTPEERLSVIGGIKVDQAGTNNGDLNAAIKFGAGATGEGIASKRTSGGNQNGLDFYTNSTNRLSIANGGNVGIGMTSPSYKLDVNGVIRCTALTQASDVRLKTDIRTLSGSLDSVMKLRGVSFDWKDAGYPEGRQIGVIAQEVEKVFPELVSRDADGYESVAYDKLIPVLIEAMKEQQDRIDARDARIGELEARLERLEKLLEAGGER